MLRVSVLEGTVHSTKRCHRPTLLRLLARYIYLTVMQRWIFRWGPSREERGPVVGAGSALEASLAVQE